MSSVNPSDHINHEKRISSSRIHTLLQGKGNTTRPLVIILTTTFVAFSLLVGLGNASPTYAATNAPHSTSTTSVQSPASITNKKHHYTAVEGAYYYTIALRSDGSVWAWGRNLLGELGVSEKIRYRHSFSPVRIPTLSNVITISTSGGDNNAAVQADGTVWQWGNGTTPSQVPGITSAKNIDVGGNLTLAILQNGTVRSWHTPAQAGDVERTHKLHTISGLKDIVQVESTGLQGYALKKDGSVWTWQESDDPSRSPSKPTKIKALNNISTIAAVSDSSLLVLDQKGKVWLLNSDGKITPYHHELKVKKMDASSRYTLLLTTSGEVYSYGGTVTGKQGKVNQLSGIADISAGYYHSLARSAEGTVWGWGGDKYQEAGAPATSPGGMVYIPVQARIGTDVFINGELFQSSYPAIETPKTVQLPMKVIATAIGAEFKVHTVDGIIGNYTIKYNNRIVTVDPADSSYTVTNLDSRPGQEVKRMALSEPISIYSGATAMPYELLRELGLNVVWNSETTTLTIDDVK